MRRWPDSWAHLVVADPPYFNVLRKEAWDCQWNDQDEYLQWTVQWLHEAMRLLVPGGLLYCFGQVGKREHVMLHLMSQASQSWQFHDLVVWDRLVGYNNRKDSYTPAHEMMLVLRKDGATPRFNKDAVREPYPPEIIAKYARDKRYKNVERRVSHLRRGKYLTNIWRVPSLKGPSKEKVGHPSQKPEELIRRIIMCSTEAGDWVLDPFLGSGTTAVVARALKRRWLGIELDPDYVQMAKTRLKHTRMHPYRYIGK
jgi:site-specific DNA-methyltransferase (adenine-specific)